MPQVAQRIASIPPYLFARMDKVRKELVARGVDVISLAIGDPDVPTPGYVVDALYQAAQDASTHRYPPYEGLAEFRRAMARRYRDRFGVELDPDREVMTLIGSKEGIAHLFWAFVDPGDVVLLPDPAYPVYRTHAALCGARIHSMPLLPENGFLPDLEAIPEEVARAAKLMFINYPNNPTAGVADLEFMRRAVDFARRYDILLCHDAAYVENTYDGYVAPSVLQVDGAKDVAIEFYSLSKPFNMTGWRLGAAVGNAEAVAGLGVIKTNTDSGQFAAVQRAGVKALLDNPDHFIASMNEVYRQRRDLVVSTLRDLGFDVRPPRGSFYIWLRVPQGYTDEEFSAHLLEKAGVMVTPGSAYGETGRSFVRISLTVPTSRLEEAMGRLRNSL
ncbi:MAG: LL-diaminopimelate aminotransferase [Bacillota bacterium]